MRMRPVLILGMHRSGTSLLAQIVHNWGLSAGPADCLLPADGSNQDGYWEYQPLVSFNTKALKTLKSSWLVPPVSEESVIALEKQQWVALEARQLIARMDSHDSPWMWKDPRLCLLLPFWLRILSNPVFIVAVRNPLCIAISMHKRDGCPKSAALLLWQLYLTSLLRNVSGRQNTIFVEYERLTTEPEQVCARIDEFLSAIYLTTGPGPGRSAQMARTVRKDLCHTDIQGDMESDASVSKAQRHLYYLLRSFAGGTEVEFNIDVNDIYPGWREYLILWEGVRSLLLTANQRL